MGRQSSGGWATLLMVVGAAIIVLIAVYWLFLILSIAGSVVWGIWALWHDDEPGGIGYGLKRRLAPYLHYPFVGVGSVIATVFGADAVHEIVKGSNTALSIVILIIVLARSVSMAWFPWPRTRPAGLRVYPWVTITGPLGSGLGMVAVWVMVIGGQTTGPVHNHAYWLAMSAAPAAVLIMILSGAVGRAGRILVPSSAPNRIDIGSVLTLTAPDDEMTLPRTPWPNHSQGTHLIPPIGPPEGPWAAVRPSLRLNWRRLFWVPIGAAVGAGAAMAMVEVYHAGNPLPEAMGLMAAILVWLKTVVGPLLFTFLYADQECIGERGLWWRHAVSRRDYRCATGTNHLVDLIGYQPGAARTSHRPEHVRLRLKWREEQLVPVARAAEPNPGLQASVPG